MASIEGRLLGILLLAFVIKGIVAEWTRLESDLRGVHSFLISGGNPAPNGTKPRQDHGVCV